MSSLIEIVPGEEWTILATPEVFAAIESMAGTQKLKEKAKLLRHLELFGSRRPGERAFTDEQVKLEGAFKTGCGNETVQVWAFKAFQSRLYGCNDGKGRRLILTECDLSKKRNKANRGKLEAAARKFGEWTR